MFFMIFLICALSFIAGLILGVKSTEILSIKAKKRNAEIQRLKEEFKNFLEYDGSEQL